MKQKSRSIVLLSGGMDSAVALYWAIENTELVKILFFGYGQKNLLHEGTAGARLMVHAWTKARTVVPGQFLKLPHLFTAPFKPARNLVFISVATVYAGYLKAEMIIGGWSLADQDFPDCHPDFLKAACWASTYSLGPPRSPDTLFINVMSPLIDKTKPEIIELGNTLGVPWGLTRSCYKAGSIPCNNCRACKKRIQGFLDHGTRDPLYSPHQWQQLQEERSTTNEDVP